MRFNLYLRFLVLFVGLSLAGLSVQAQGPLSLLPVNQATHVVQSSGNWTSASTWQGGTVPNAQAKVLIPAGLTLTVDAEISTRIKIIRIQGKMAFSTTANTALKVETIIQDSTGELEMGTSTNPIPAGTTCKITITDEGDLVWSTSQFEKGLTLMGKTVAYGAQKDSWRKVTTNPGIGATTLSLSSAPTGWVAGDRIVITGTDPTDAASDEVATIQSISGSTVTLSQPLTKSHTTPAADLFVHVANLSRNIEIVSESPTSNGGMDRGHIMWMHTLDVDFNYARLFQMGRTRKDKPIDDWYINENDSIVDSTRTNIRGRYSIHFHRGGVSPNLTPAKVKGCVVEDDPGWAYANHSGFVHFDDNVSYNVIGGGFQTESGDELGSFTNNIAIRTVNPAYPLRLSAPLNAPDTREGSQDFAFQGDGFWIHGGGVSATGNIASGSSGHGFIYWPEGLIEPVKSREAFRNTFLLSNLGLPTSVKTVQGEVDIATGWVKIAGFKDNEAYSSTIGLSMFYLHTTFFNDISDYDPAYIDSLHSTFDGFTGWNIKREGIQLNFTERVSFKNIRLINDNVDTASIGIKANHYRALEKLIFNEIDIQGFGTGIALPRQGEVTVNCGTLKNGNNMLINNPVLATRDMRIENLSTSLDNRFSNPIDIKVEESFSPPEDKISLYFLLPDKIILNYGSYTNQRLFFDEQDANYVPLPTDADPYTFFNGERYILTEFAQKTNQQLQTAYQMSFGGSLLPSNAVSAAGISGGKIRTWQNETLNVPICVDQFSERQPDQMNNCWTSAGSNKVAGPLAAYTHPLPACMQVSTDDPFENENRIVLYPNPTTGIFTIAGDPSEYKVDIVNFNGVLVQSLTQSGNQVEVNISNSPAGMYFIRVRDMKSGAVSTQKVVKLR